MKKEYNKEERNRKANKILLIIGIVLLVFQVLAMLGNATAGDGFLPQMVSNPTDEEAFGNVAGMLGYFWMAILGVILIAIALLDSRK